MTTELEKKALELLSNMATFLRISGEGKHLTDKYMDFLDEVIDSHKEKMKELVK